ncbi:AbrB family transcriptional regulator [Lysinibacillus yapensis]|uniref:AbrB family transcriptional regulator n=2 Tax=Ureibacillus yapensis TaxID=2304605 RepID=A0A396SEH0_9BACL|nr:AbrB family transcriptional regulator [Lysinibacillus yapensis]
MLHLPVPWMLGPLFALLIGQFFIKHELVMPVQLRNAGLVVIGVSIGQTFQLDVFAGLGWLIFVMLLINISIVMVSVLMAWGLYKMSDLSLKTALTCTVPGGLSQIVVFAEEEKDIDLAAVAYFHVVRVICIVMLIPFILSAHENPIRMEDSLNAADLLPLLLLFLVAGASVWIGKKIKVPVPYFLTPVLLIIFSTFAGIDTPHIPSILLHVSQLLLGAYIGLLLKPKMIRLGKKVVLFGIGSALFLLLATFGQAYFLVYFFDYSMSTSFLSTAAGGLDQMSLLATAIGADVSVVTVFQIFRLLFVFLIILPLLKMACAYIDRKQSN